MQTFRKKYEVFMVKESQLIDKYEFGLQRFNLENVTGR